MSDIEMPAEGVDLGLNNGECDVLREKERQARVRAHLVDDSFDINSSSLFFGDPIKVVPQHEDETARRIKRTLGDFNLMRIYLLKDPRRLIGISKTAAFTSNTARCQSENGTIIKSFSVQSSPALSLSSYESAWSPQSPSLPNESYCANSETHLPENFSPLKVEQRCTTPSTSNCCNNSRKSVHYNIITNCQHDEGKAINNFNFSSGDQKQSSLPSKLSEKENDTEKAIHSLPATAIMLHRHTSENNNSTSSLKISTEGRTHQIFCQPINKENTPQRKQTCPILDTTQDQANSKSKRHTDVESILVEMKEVVPFPLTAIATPHREKIVNFSPLRKHVPSSQRNTTNLNKKKKKAHSYPDCSHQKDFQDSDEESVLAVRRLEQLGSDRSDYSDILNPPLPTEIMSSIESSSSDSEESSSGSESKESNLSGRVSPESPAKHSTQSWGLANFMEKKDLRPLASLKDANSSSYHHKVQHPVMSNQQNITLDLADKDSVNWILGKYSSDDIKDYLQSPSPNLLDFDSEALSPNREGQLLLSPIISSPLLKEEDTESEKDALNTHLSEEEKCRSEIQRNNNIRWLEKNYGSETKGAFADQEHCVKVQVHTGKTEENLNISESEKSTNIFCNQYSSSLSFTPEMSSSTVSRADSTVKSSRPTNKSTIYDSPLHSSSSNNSYKYLTSFKYSQETIQNNHYKTKKTTATSKSPQKLLCDGYVDKSIARKEEEIFKMSDHKMKNGSGRFTVAKSASLHSEKKSHKQKPKRMVKRNTLKIKSQEIIQSDSSDSDEHETFIALRNVSSNVKNIDNEKFSLKEKSPSVTSSLSRRHRQKIKNGDTHVISTNVSNSSHLTDVINGVAKGDFLCLDSCSDNEKHVPLNGESNLLTKSFDYTTMLNCENPIKIDSAIILSPIHNGRTPKALPEHKENAIPCVLVNINLGLINRVPVYPPIDRTISGKEKDKIQSKDSIKSSPREHLKEIKDLNRKSVCLSPMCDNLSSVKSKEISTQSTPKTQKRKAEEDNRGNEKKHKMSATASIPPEAQVTVKHALMERDQLWSYKSSQKSSRNCDSPASLSVCSYSSHQSVLSVSSAGKSHHKDKKDELTSRYKLKVKPLHYNNDVAETFIPHSSNKEIENRVKMNDNEKYTSCRDIEKHRSKKNLSSVASKKCKSNFTKESSHKSHSERTLSSCKEMCSADQEEGGESSHIRNIQSLEHNNNKGQDWPLFKHKLYLDHHMKSFSSDNYLNEAKEMKRQADREVDRTVQAMKYLEAVLYFTLTGNAMEHNHVDNDKVYTMYKETLGLIRHISSNFQNSEHTFSSGNIDRRLAVLSLRCQSLLYLKLYRLQRFEVRELHKSLSEFQKSSVSQMASYPSPCHHRNCGGPGPNGVPSPHSPTPSPAGSQSSGYSSSELTGCCNTLQSRKGYSNFYTLAPSHLPSSHHQIVGIPQNIYNNLLKQNTLLTNLHLCVDLWEQADCLIEHSGSREFFSALDKSCGHLTLHSSFSDLVRYVRAGLYRLKEGN